MQTSRWSSNRLGPYTQQSQWNPQRAKEHHSQQFNRTQYNFNEKYWCETCDRGFPTQDLLNKHKQQHQKCNIDGCQFVAHPKMITKHIQMQHSTGLFKKIAKLNNPEDILKWITERKKKYPTKINVEKKAAERKEKIERGEKIGLQSNCRNNNRQGTDRKRKLFDGGKQHNQKHSKNHHQNVKKYKRNEIDRDLPATRNNYKLICPDTEVSASKKLKHFTGIRNIILDSDHEEEPEQGPYLTDDDEQLQKAAVKEPKVCDALLSLISNYDSTDEEVEFTKEVNAKANMEYKAPEILNIPLGKDSNKLSESVQDNIHSGDESGPEEVKNTKKTIDTVTPKQENYSEEVKNTKTNKEEFSRKVNATENMEYKAPETLNIPLGKDSNKLSESVQDNICSGDDSGPEEVKNTKKTIDTVTPKQENYSKAEKIQEKKKLWIDNKNIKKNHLRNRVKTKLPSTLLQKLLQREIKQERNIVLQCVNYIVKQNYFDKP